MLIFFCDTRCHSAFNLAFARRSCAGEPDPPAPNRRSSARSKKAPHVNCPGPSLVDLSVFGATGARRWHRPTRDGYCLASQGLCFVLGVEDSARPSEKTRGSPSDREARDERANRSARSRHASNWRSGFLLVDEPSSVFRRFGLQNLNLTCSSNRRLSADSENPVPPSDPAPYG